MTRRQGQVFFSGAGRKQGEALTRFPRLSPLLTVYVKAVLAGWCYGIQHLNRSEERRVGKECL